jgi:hypothetical protein
MEADPVSFFYLLVALAALVLLLVLLNLRSAWRRRRGLPYALRRTLFSAEEMAFLAALDEAVGTDYRVFGKVRLSDLVAVQRGVGKRAMESATARIEPVRIAFLVCDRASGKPTCAVDLVGGKSREARGRGPDKALGRACDSVGLPLVRVPVADTYSTKALAEQIYTAINAPKVSAPVAGAKGLRLDEGVSRAEEERALSVLAAAIRERDPLPRPPAF